MNNFDDIAKELRAMQAEADRELTELCVRSVKKAVDAGVAEAKSTRKYKDRSGALTDSIDGRVTSVGNASATGVFEATAPHAVYVDEGTKPHVIRPKNGKYLVFPGRGGSTVFAREVNHPGTKADGFFERGAVACERVLEASVDDGITHIETVLTK